MITQEIVAMNTLKKRWLNICKKYWLNNKMNKCYLPSIIVEFHYIEDLILKIKNIAEISFSDYFFLSLYIYHYHWSFSLNMGQHFLGPIRTQSNFIISSSSLAWFWVNFILKLFDCVNFESNHWGLYSHLQINRLDQISN